MEGKSDNGLGEWVTKRIQTVGKYLSQFSAVFLIAKMFLYEDVQDLDLTIKLKIDMYKYKTGQFYKQVP